MAAGRRTIFRVRLCFEIEAAHSLTGIEAPLEIDSGADGLWSLKEVAASTRLRGQRLDLRSPRMASEDDAVALGGRARSALMVATLRRGFAVSLSERLPGGRLYDAGRRLLAGDRFDALLDDVLGLTVYRETGTVGFVGIPPVQAHTGSPAAAFIHEWSDAFGSAGSSSEAAITSFDLWAGSRSESSSRVRLLLLVMAVEALVDQPPRPENEIELIDQFLSEIRASSLDSEAQERLRNGLSLLKRKSIGSSCQSLVTDRLGEEAGRTFRKCYRLRNVIAHGGKAPDPRNLLHDANQLEPVVKALIASELAGRVQPGT